VSSCFPCVVRYVKLFLLASSMQLIFHGFLQSPVFGQETLSLTSELTNFPDAPQPAKAATQAGAIGSQQVGIGSISGTVLDKNRDVLQGTRDANVSSRVSHALCGFWKSRPVRIHRP